MYQDAKDRIDAIHGMLESGHRSVRLESHTLLLWGLAAAGLIMGINAYFTPERFPDVWQRSLAANFCIASVLLVVGFTDFRLTRRARGLRDETISFVQRQLTKVWWLLIGMIVLINLGMNFFGGGYLFYGIVLAIMGVAFYIHGLFSQQMLSMIGGLLILLGLGGVLFNLPYYLIEWGTVFVFGIGFPLMAWIIKYDSGHISLHKRVILCALWLTAIAIPTLVVQQQAQSNNMFAGQVIGLRQYQLQEESSQSQIVNIPAGTPVPMRIELQGDVLQGTTMAELPTMLSQPLDLEVASGQLAGRYRVNNGPWNNGPYYYRVENLDIRMSLSPDQGPLVSLKLKIKTNQ